MMGEAGLNGNHQRGVALVICISSFNKEDSKRIDRPGAEKDGKMLRAVFEQLGFKVSYFHNIPSWQILKEATKVARRNHTAYDSLVVALSTHGDVRRVKSEEDYGLEGFDFYDEEELLFGTDGPFPFGDLTKAFNEKNCPTLQNKPKLFFIQACRGTGLAESVTVTSKAPADSSDRIEMDYHHKDVEHSVDLASVLSPRPVTPLTREIDKTEKDNFSNSIAPGKLHNEKDMECEPSEPIEPNEEIVSKKVVISRDYLVMWACPPGYFAFHTSEGSPFISWLARVLTNRHNEADLLTMLTEVNRGVATDYEASFAGPKQYLNKRHIVPSIEHMLRKPVWLRDVTGNHGKSQGGTQGGVIPNDQQVDRGRAAGIDGAGCGESSHLISGDPLPTAQVAS